MDKVFEKGTSHQKEPAALGLCPIRHKEFNEFIKGKGFKGKNNYKLADLKAMFGFKPMITGSPVTISSDELEPIGTIIALKYAGVCERTNLVDVSNHFSKIVSLFSSQWSRDFIS